MKIVYNPDDGAPIKDFRFGGIEHDPHFPDGYEFRNKDGVTEISKGLMQYPDDVADALLETFQFLQLLTPEKAQEIVDRPPEPKYICEYPGCEYKSRVKVALMQHSKTHKDAIDQAGSIPVVDPAAIPVSAGKKVAARPLAGAQRPDMSSVEKETQNGLDQDGVEWYGDGVQIESPSGFGPAKPAGKGHFQG